MSDERRPPADPFADLVGAFKGVLGEVAEGYQRDAVGIAKKAAANLGREVLTGKRLAEGRELVKAADQACGGLFSFAAKLVADEVKAPKGR